MSWFRKVAKKGHFGKAVTRQTCQKGFFSRLEIAKKYAENESRSTIETFDRKKGLGKTPNVGEKATF